MRWHASVCGEALCVKLFRSVYSAPPTFGAFCDELGMSRYSYLYRSGERAVCCRPIATFVQSAGQARTAVGCRLADLGLAPDFGSTRRDSEQGIVSSTVLGANDWGLRIPGISRCERRRTHSIVV